MRIDCIIVEDEPLAQERIRSYLERLPFMNLVGVFDGAIDALAFLQTGTTIDLIFLDINMGDFSGIQLLESMTINSQVILSTAYHEYALKGYELNLDKAKKLLKEAGYPEGKGLPSFHLLTVSEYADFASFIVRQLEDIGLKVQVEVVQKSLLLEQTARSQALFFRGSWFADYPDAENYLSVFYSRNPAPPNYTRFHDAAFDRLYEQALLENNDSARYVLYRRMDQLVMDAAPVVPIWYDQVIRLVDPRVQGLHPNALNLLELRRVDITK